MQSSQGLLLTELEKISMQNLKVSDHITLISPSKDPAVEFPLETMMTPLQSSNDVTELHGTKR